jgi:hypothetical protein
LLTAPGVQDVRDAVGFVGRILAPFCNIGFVRRQRRQCPQCWSQQCPQQCNSKRKRLRVEDAKTGSNTFLDNFNNFNYNAKEPAHIEWSAFCAGQGSLYTTLREPTAHAISMYNHCQHGDGMGFHHYDRVSLKEWLTAWASADRATADKLLRKTCGFNPRNLQTSRLGGATCKGEGKRVPTLAGARHALRAAKSVGITHWMDASVCVAHFKLHGSLPATCTDICSASAEHLGKATHGVNHTLVDSSPVDASTLDLIWGLTRADQIIYADAVGRFVQDAQAIEQAAGVHLLCADVGGGPVDGFINTTTHLVKPTGRAHYLR